MPKSIYSKKGFTLMELLIVVAIIAVLIAIAIPVFSNAINKAKEATCLANRRALKAELATEYMLGELAVNANTETGLTASQAKLYTCPNGGTITYTYKDGIFTVKCSHHDETTQTSMPAYTIADKMSDIITTIKTAADANHANGIIDSTASTKSTADIAKAFAENGIDLKNMGATSWSYRDKCFFWTDQDISKVSAGTKVAVARYNISTQTYTVWYSTVENTDGYNHITSPSTNDFYSDCKNYSASEQTYDKAVKWLKDAQAA